MGTFLLRLRMLFITALCGLLLTSRAASDPHQPPAEVSKTHHGLSIALHAQADYKKHGWVAGSEVTTTGLSLAMERSPLVNSTYRFSPFNYGKINEVRFDLVVVEGYIGTVPRFIYHLRKANPGIVVVHWCLDTFPSFEKILALDVDAFLTNSRELNQVIFPSHGFQSWELLFAADTSVFRPNPDPSSEYAGVDIVYVGQVREESGRGGLYQPFDPLLTRLSLSLALAYLVITSEKAFKADATGDGGVLRLGPVQLCHLRERLGL